MREEVDDLEGYLHNRPQPAFMPGHAYEPDLDFRVLAWNSAGQVALRSEDGFTLLDVNVG